MFRLRPLALWITAFAVGILCAVFADGIISAVTFALLGVLCVLCVAVRRFPYRATLFPLFLAVLIGFSYLSVREAIVERTVSDSYGQTADVAGDVVETDAYGFTMSLVSGGGSGLSSGTKVFVYYDYDKTLSAGDRVYGRFEFSEPSLRLQAEGVLALATGDVARADMGSGQNLLMAVKSRACRFLRQHYSVDTTGVATAVLTGERSGIDPMLNAAYRSSGISHLLVISGFHMSLVLMTAYSVLSFTPLGKRYSGIICIALALAFSGFVGFTPSVTRAMVMCVAVFVGGTLNYKNDSFTSLFTALGVLLVWNPYSLFSVGLQLSFLCTLGIITVSPAIQKKIIDIKNRFWRGIASALSSVAMSGAAALFSFPVAAYVFGEFSVVSPLVNLPVLPLFNIAAGAGYVSFIFPPASFLADILFKCINEIARFCHSLGVSTVSTRIYGMGLVWVAAAVSVIVISSVHIKRRVKTFGICCCVFVLLVLGSIGVNRIIDNSRVRVSSVSDNGITWAAVSSEGECLFIDRGGLFDTDVVFKLGHTCIDAYIMLDCDEKGLNNFVSALSEVGVKRLYISNRDREVSIYKRLLFIAESHGITTQVFEENITLPIGGSYITAGETEIIKYKEDIYYIKRNTDGLVYLDGKE